MAAPLPQEPSLRELRPYLAQILDITRDLHQQLTDMHEMMKGDLREAVGQMTADLSRHVRAIDKDL